MLSQIKLYPEWSEAPIKQTENKHKDPKNSFPNKNFIYFIYFTYNFPFLSEKHDATIQNCKKKK